MDSTPNNPNNTPTNPTPKKKTSGALLIIIGIVAIVLIVGGIMAFFAVQHFLAGIFHPNVVNTPFGQIDTSKGSEQVTIKTDKGEFSAGAGLPKDFPSDVPVYPNGKAEGHFGGIVTFSTHDTPDQIATFYESKLKDQGWEITTTTLADMRMINGQKDNRKVGITANPNKDKSQTDILISIDTKK